MRFKKINKVFEKQVKWVRTAEDWYPTLTGSYTCSNPDYCNPLPDPAVRVFVTQLTTLEWRVAIWGGDDFGLEIDLPEDHRYEAYHLFDHIQDFTTQAELRQWGLHHV